MRFRQSPSGPNHPEASKLAALLDFFLQIGAGLDVGSLQGKLVGPRICAQGCSGSNQLFQTKGFQLAGHGLEHLYRIVAEAFLFLFASSFDPLSLSINR